MTVVNELWPVVTSPAFPVAVHVVPFFRKLGKVQRLCFALGFSRLAAVYEIYVVFSHPSPVKCRCFSREMNVFLERGARLGLLSWINPILCAKPEWPYFSVHERFPLKGPLYSSQTWTYVVKFDKILSLRFVIMPIDINIH